jgi:glycosyltransferase involved in cell wall biosynthesis
MKPTLTFVSLWDAAKPNEESGYAYSMRRHLQRFFHVLDLFPLALPGEWLSLPLRAAYRAGGRYYHPMREPAVLTALARRIERALAATKPDVVFAPSSVPMSFVETPRPLVYATDQLFCDFVESYIRLPAARFRRLGDAQEVRALASAARASYPSDWAAKSAVAHYGGDRSKIVVIPWGANLPREISDSEVAHGIAQRRMDRCHLVFIGRDWLRKGGDLLVATVKELNRRGLKTHATIIGHAARGLPADQFTVHPFLDKTRPDHFARFASAMLSAHFIFLPARAEAYGQAICEAMAFGVPAIGSTVGGIPAIIKDGETGYLKPRETPSSEFAALIQRAMASPAHYYEMAEKARDDYRRRLNWDSFGEGLNRTVAALV